MLKYIVLLGIMGVLVNCQRRPTYAGTGNRYPVVLPQYVNENQQTIQTSIANRIGESISSSSSPVSSTPTAEIKGDGTQVDWIKTWDPEKQPFWYLNRKHIQEHIGAAPSAPATDSGKPILRS